VVRHRKNTITDSFKRHHKKNKGKTKTLIDKKATSMNSSQAIKTKTPIDKKATSMNSFQAVH
jgi:hypothetical protein